MKRHSYASAAQSAFAALLIILSLTTSLAQVTAVPPQVNFQGRLTRTDGTPVANCAKLSGTLSEEQRREYRAEMRDHLEAMIEAHKELGASPAEAVQSALEQFGNAQRVAIAWEDTVEHPERVSLRQVLRAPVKWFGGMMLTYMLLFVILAKLEISLSNGVRDMAVLLWIFGMPLLAGVGTGLTTRGRPILGTLLAMIPLHLILPMFYWLIAPLFSEDAIPITEIQFVSWTLVGATTAWLTHKERRRKWRKRKLV